MRNPRNEPLVGTDIAGAAEGADAPERRCVLTGRHGAREELLRLALSPDGDILPDVLARAPGRGAWITMDRAALEEGLANGKLRGALARAFRTSRLMIPGNLAEMAEQALRRALSDRLGLEWRTGGLLLGNDRIASEARMGRVAALYHSADASPDGARKLDQAWRVGSDAEGTGLAGERLPLDRDALSVALGRGNVVHLALADEASARRVEIPLRRLLNYIGAANTARRDVGGADNSAPSDPATV